MKKELDEKLCAAYPLIFKNRFGDMKETLMCWGFECGDGWYNIIDRLCANIQGHIDWSIKQKAWAIKWNAEHPDDQRTVKEPCPQVVAVQIKEKFGTLRFYVDGGDEVVQGMIRMAESMSGVTCEECGNPGRSRNGGWIRTLCDHHEAEYQNRYKEAE